jgi:hypothetical protein
VIDCHCVCTAIAYGYEAEGRPLGSDPLIWYAAASLKVDYLRPAMIQRALVLRSELAYGSSPKKRQLFPAWQDPGRRSVDGQRS